MCTDLLVKKNKPKNKNIVYILMYLTKELCVFNTVKQFKQGSPKTQAQVVEEVIRFFILVKVLILYCKNTPIQVKVQ